MSINKLKTLPLAVAALGAALATGGCEKIEAGAADVREQIQRCTAEAENAQDINCEFEALERGNVNEEYLMFIYSVNFVLESFEQADWEMLRELDEEVESDALRNLVSFHEKVIEAERQLFKILARYSESQNLLEDCFLERPDSMIVRQRRTEGVVDSLNGDYGHFLSPQEMALMEIFPEDEYQAISAIEVVNILEALDDKQGNISTKFRIESLMMKLYTGEQNDSTSKWLFLYSLLNIRGEQSLQMRLFQDQVVYEYIQVAENVIKSDTNYEQLPQILKEMVSMNDPITNAYMILEEDMYPIVVFMLYTDYAEEYNVPIRPIRFRAQDLEEANRRGIDMSPFKGHIEVVN